MRYWRICKEGKRSTQQRELSELYFYTRKGAKMPELKSWRESGYRMSEQRMWSLKILVFFWGPRRFFPSIDWRIFVPLRSRTKFIVFLWPMICIEIAEQLSLPPSRGRWFLPAKRGFWTADLDDFRWKCPVSFFFCNWRKEVDMEEKVVACSSQRSPALLKKLKHDHLSERRSGFMHSSPALFQKKFYDRSAGPDT